MASLTVLLTAGIASGSHTIDAQCFGEDITLAGTDGPDDPLNGTSEPDIINAGDGSDSVYGLGANDRLCLDDANDFSEGAGGADRIRGGSGGDVIKGGSGDDLMLRGDGNLHPSSDAIYGGNGNDVLTGNEGEDLLEGLDDNDDLYDGTGADNIIGGPGTDVWLNCPGDTGDIVQSVEFVFTDASYC